MDRRMRPPLDVAVCVTATVEWALGQVGSGSYETRCLSFVEDAYEIPNEIEVFGGDTAAESAEMYRAGRPTDIAPRGSFVFFATSGPIDGIVRAWGHVGLALGDGRMVHAWPDIRVDPISDVPRLPSGDWTAPRPLGWAAPERILRDAVAR
ncbi:MAG TPA: hypothetical protein VJ506_07940 [Candidatus Limnocylindrales bacterium]|nr:hypothetical protein [Candidatus Limnocylindrales bacterium]